MGEKRKAGFEKIESLIVDGQKEVLERVGRVEENLGSRIADIASGLGEVKTDIIVETIYSLEAPRCRAWSRHSERWIDEVAGY